MADCPLDTQTAAPPAVPPRRPIVVAAMADDFDFASQFQRLQDLGRQLATAQRETQAALARLRARLDRY